jgi:hypothetical protein
VTESTAARVPVADASWARRELRAFAELFALCGFAIALPLLDLFGRNPGQFVFRGADRADVVVWALLVTFVPPVALWVVEAIVGLVLPRVRTVLHLVLVGGLAAAFVVQAMRSVVDGVVLFVLASVVGVGAALLRERVTAARTWLAFASLAPLVFLGLFLVDSETATLLSADEPRAVDAGVGNPAPVVMLVFDELPLTALIDADGVIDAELYPNVAELAGDAHWFRNTTAVSSSTWYAVPSLATGRYPEDGTAPIAADHPESLFTLLGGAYEMNVTESVTRLCPTEICRSTLGGRGGLDALVGDAVDVMRARLSLHGAQGDPVAALVEESEAAGADDHDEVAGEEPGQDAFADFALDQPARFSTLVDGIDGDAAALHYLHILLPHVPYRYLPDGVQYDSPDPDLGRIDDDWVDEPWLPRLGRQRLQLQAAYVDALVGELTAQLRAQGIYDDALIVLTADHGIAFEPGGPIRGIEGQPLDDSTLAQLAWVPFLLKEPGQTAGEVSDANVETVDVLPTIADVLDVALPWPVDGRSALGPPRRGDTKTFYPSDVNAFGVEALDPIELDAAARWRDVLERAVDTVLPPVGSADRFWRIGPRSELVGTPVAEAGALEPVDARLEAGDAFEAVDPESGRAPALVRGALDVEGTVAVAVNGVVAATAPTYRDGDSIHFAVMVDDARLRAGANEIAVFLVG